MRLCATVVIAVCAAASAAGWYQQQQISRLTAELSSARQALVIHVAAQDRKVIDAFELGRTQQARALQKQKEVLDALNEKNRAAAGDLERARDRVRQQLAATVGVPGGADVPSAGPQACDADNAYRNRVLEAARILVDGVLQVGADADEAARNFNALIQVDQHSPP